MKKLMILAAFALLGCTNTEATERTLKKQGFTNITITGWAPLSCSEDDTFSTGFRATNASGDTVDGTVCCGLIFKNCTVRW